MRCYGNTGIDDAPFSELFYVGGANSIRAFNVRGIGPGSFNGTKDGIVAKQRQFNYVVQNGDIKFVANLEYRTRLFGNLGGAIFLDAGNVWRWNDPVFTSDDLKELATEEEYSQLNDDERQKIIDYMNDWFSGWAPRSSTIFDQIALGTGVGLRYDLGFLVIRIDWGLALHMPYKTNRSGYFNVDSFRDAQALHFAVGYPF
jgi:outer membrane protein assembly factor BamA